MRRLVGLVLGMIACGGGSDGTTVHVQGKAQKGPFITGSSVQLYPLDENLVQVGKAFPAFIADDLGTFDTSVTFAEPNVEVDVTGIYADERTGDLSTGQLTLRAVAAADDTVSVHINLLTTIAQRRLVFLVGHGTPFAMAAARAKDDLFGAFAIDSASLDELSAIDLAGGTPSSGAAIAVSAVLLELAAERAQKPDQQVAALSTVISELGADLESDGVLTAAHTKELAKAAHFVDLDAVRTNLTAIYTRLGATIEIPDLTPSVEPLASLYPWARHGAVPAFDEHVAGCAIGAKVYFAGGCDDASCSPASNKLWEYDPATDKLAAKMAMPTARASATCGVVDGKLYVIGGLANGTDSSSALTDIEVYDPTTDTWTSKSPAPAPTWGRRAATIGTKIYLVGSTGDLTVPSTNDVDVYDPAAETWTPKQVMKQSRAYAAVCASGTKIYAFGGLQRGATAVVALGSAEVYDATSDLWGNLSMALPSARGAAGCAAINNKVYVAGGQDATGATQVSELVEYDPVANKFTQKTPMDVGGHVPAAAVVDGKLVVANVNTATRIDRYDPAKDQ